MLPWCWFVLGVCVFMWLHVGSDKCMVGNERQTLNPGVSYYIYPQPGHGPNRGIPTARVSLPLLWGSARWPIITVWGSYPSSCWRYPASMSMPLVSAIWGAQACAGLGFLKSFLTRLHQEIVKRGLGETPGICNRGKKIVVVWPRSCPHYRLGRSWLAHRAGQHALLVMVITWKHTIGLGPSHWEDNDVGFKVNLGAWWMFLGDEGCSGLCMYQSAMDGLIPISFPLFYWGLFLGVFFVGFFWGVFFFGKLICTQGLICTQSVCPGKSRCVP